MMLLATQVNNPLIGIGTAEAAAMSNAPEYEVSIQTNGSTADNVVVVADAHAKPDYESDVMAKIRAAQADAAQKAADAKAAADAQAKADQAIAAQNAVQAQLASAVSLPAGSHTDWMAAAGIAASDYGYVDYIVDNESGWGVTKWNYGGSGAYGLGQALPASKMAVYGDDYLTNPVTQLKWADASAKGRYGSWAAAYNYWVNYHVW
jgi:hypothetical protein